MKTQVTMAAEEFKVSMDVEEFIAAEFKTGERMYLDTAWGYQYVSHIRWPEDNPWAVCPEENGGYGLSYCVHYGTLLFFEGALRRSGKL